MAIISLRCWHFIFLIKEIHCLRHLYHICSCYKNSQKHLYHISTPSLTQLFIVRVFAKVFILFYFFIFHYQVLNDISYYILFYFSLFCFIFYIYLCTCTTEHNNLQSWLYPENCSTINHGWFHTESFAELYHGCSTSLIKYHQYSTQTLVIIVFLLLSLHKLLNSLSLHECLSIRS